MTSSEDAVTDVCIRGLTLKRSPHSQLIRNLSAKFLKTRSPQQLVYHVPVLIEALVTNQHTDPSCQVIIDALCSIGDVQKHIENDNNVVPIHLLGHAQVCVFHYIYNRFMVNKQQ
jgi:hypothetical protein